MQNHLSIRLFILLSHTAFYLYIGFFTYYLTTLNFTPLSISILIGSTTLSNIFFGPTIGKFIDNFPNKVLLLILGIASAGITIFCFSLFTHTEQFILTLFFVILFSILLSLNSIITTQYIITKLNNNYDIAYAHYSKLTSLGLIISSLLLAFLYNKFPASYFFHTSTLLYLLSILGLFPFLNQHIQTETNNSTQKTHHTFSILKRYVFLVIPICCVAFTESAFNVNFEMIAFTLKSTPFFIIFLFGLINGILDWTTSFLYPKYFSPLPEKQKWQYIMASFILLFFITFLIDYFKSSHSPWFLPIFAVLLEIIGIIWGIFIATKIRNLCPDGQYGKIMAIFRIPRAIITFIGIIGIGAILNHQALWLIFLLNSLLFLFTIIALYYWREKL